MRVLLRVPAGSTASRTDRPIEFHRRLPGYRETPLRAAPRLAEILGVRQVFIKDETSRFGLPSFKILGAAFATYAALCERLGPLPDGKLSYGQLRSWAAAARPLTLIAATDGNHGRAVARVAGWLGLAARIFVPNFVAAGRCRAIEGEGAELVRIDGVYDAAVDAAIAAACAPGTLLVTDTARSATEIMPQWVTAGYTTALAEVEQQLARTTDDCIDVIAVQAGVGGLAAAAAGWAQGQRRGRVPRVAVVEPEHAACVMAALAAGEPVAVPANKVSAMSVLQCGTVSLAAFETLRAGVSCCLAVEDSWALRAVAALDACGIETGPSGAAGLAGLLAAVEGPLAGAVRQHLGVGPQARLLIIATEAAAAAENLGPEVLAA
jgi:diaminopropionate ammonia-lyase